MILNNRLKICDYLYLSIKKIKITIFINSKNNNNDS